MKSWVPRGAVIFDDMNPVILLCFVLAALASEPAPATLGVLATAAGSLFEATPFILAGTSLQSLLLLRWPRHARLASTILPLIGCGCDGGPSARSLPAAVATALVFGPIAAALRFLAAIASAALMSRILRKRSLGEHCVDRVQGASCLAQLAEVLPATLTAGVIVHVFGSLQIERAPAIVQWLAGGAFAFATAPCALGAVALAASLHLRAPAAALGMLCVSGIADARVFAPQHRCRAAHDALSYATLALALGIVATRRGDALVHPHFTLPLMLSAFLCASIAVVRRRSQTSELRSAPILMLAGALLVAPPPIYSATETTLTDLFPGEHLTFIGTLVRGTGGDALVRFAITCCRADAAPVAIRLTRPLRAPTGSWQRVTGVVERFGTELRLEPVRAERISAPADPFIYR